jgi:hypothetical protein
MHEASGYAIRTALLFWVCVNENRPVYAMVVHDGAKRSAHAARKAVYEKTPPEGDTIPANLLDREKSTSYKSTTLDYRSLLQEPVSL